VRAKFATLLVVLLLPGPAAAGDNGLRTGALWWHANTVGSVRYGSADPIDNIDLIRELGHRGIRSDNRCQHPEHPLPLVSNALVRGTDLDAGARGRLSCTVIFGGSRFTTGGDISSHVQFRQSDIILYYNILDNGDSVDVGVNARDTGSNRLLADSNGGIKDAHAPGWIPLLHADSGVELPITVLSPGADDAFAGIQGHGLYPGALRASYSGSHVSGAEPGYRRMKSGPDIFDASYADIEFSGTYAGLFVNF
jgi:outer membrane protein